ncbi:uncharacterized protein LOC135163945 [Diachasmimorpha longicaudata]|uniref:uncharacterized protein LOC135163945 n=1 Tax=Diachasmimorpha longicaudata TaxID=58733 RepID=UPI0030B8A824
MEDDTPLAQRYSDYQLQRIKELKKQLTNFKGQNMIIRKFLSIYKNKELEVVKVTNRINKYNAILKSVAEVCDEIERLDAENQHHSPEDRFHIEAEYYENIAEFERLLIISREDPTTTSSLCSCESIQPGHTHMKRRRFKLPESTLPTFNGEYEHWLTFKGEYEATIHSQSDLSNADKLSYLRRCLTGPALDKIRMIPITENNYNRAWTILTDTYSDDRLIISRHYKLLLNFPKQLEETAANLTKLVDDTRQHIELLKTMDVEINDETIVAIVENVLHSTTSDAWEETLKRGIFPKSKDLLDFLSQRASRLTVRDSNKQKKDHKSEVHAPKNNIKRSYAKAFVTTTDRKCSVCSQDQHPLYKCKKFREMSVNGRIQMVNKHAFCPNCLRAGHDKDGCPSKHMCWVCDERHNTLIHPGSENITVINVMNSKKGLIRARILLDTCSTTNFMTEKLANQLKLEKKAYSIPVSGINGLTTYTKHQITATIKSTTSKYQRTLTFLTIPTIASLVPSQSLTRDEIKLPKNLKLADPTFYLPGPIEMLLGSGPTLALLCVGQYVVPPDLYLQKTQLGWIVGGSSTPSSSQLKQQNFCLSADFNLEKFWALEEIPTQKFLSPEEQLAEKHYIDNYSRDSEGRYIVSLPFKQNHQRLSASREIALKRLKSLERKFNRQPDMKEQYTAVLAEYLSLNHMTQVEYDDGTGFYLPHHAVIKEASLTTKIRVVFDGSARTTDGISLNSALMVGPTIQDDIFSLLTRFRFHKYVLTGDIEKMYRQFLIKPEDRKYQKILWYDNDNQIITYQLNTVTFGLSAAPFLAIRSLHQLAQDHAQKYPVAARILRQDMYVDDLLTGFPTQEEAREAQCQISQCLQQAGLNIRQWASNDMSLLQHLPAADIHKHLHFDNDQTLKALGVFWHSQADAIHYSVKPIINSTTVTKRIILSHVASLFDPMGLLGPIILLAKSIIQKLWVDKLNWDESVPTSIHTLWTNFCDELPKINQLQFSRNVLITDRESIELHGFCDASERGYGACIYVRSSNKRGDINTSLLCSRSRVAPLKTISIPRLELCGAKTLVQLYTTVKRAIKLPIFKTIFWTDSMVALHWISSPPHQLKTFVANRVSAIQQGSPGIEWRHVKSEDNPADALSRGQLPSELITNDLWHKGPLWLQHAESTWHWKPVQQLSEDPEMKVATCLHTSPDFYLFKYYSSWIKLRRHVAIWRRYFQFLKGETPARGHITVEELTEAKLSIIKVIQPNTFQEEFKGLASNRADTPYTGKFKPLAPFIDSHGILRVGGRLQKANISFDQKHPILLPKNHHITNIIIQEEHSTRMHPGVQTTLHCLRRQFWLSDGRAQVRKIIRQCIPCLRARPPVPQYPMGILPTTRVNATTRAFTHVGVDYCGPFQVKETKYRNRASIKVYVAVFVCLAVKAVHLEVVSDLTTEAFLGALRRFIGRRGKPVIIQSDNGTNFVGANNELQKIIAHIHKSDNNHKITSEMTAKGIDWRFSPPLAPHFGGIWEAAVKSFKHHLRRVIGAQLLTLEQFSTLTTEIEGILNSRPLYAVSTDPNDLAALTPSHFLIGEELTSLPEHDLQHVKVNRLSPWQHIQQMRQHFWNRWHKEYLNELNMKRKWSSGSHNITTGTMVLLRDDNIPSMQWKIGRIIETHPGKDLIGCPTAFVDLEPTSRYNRRILSSNNNNLGIYNNERSRAGGSNFPI